MKNIKSAIFINTLLLAALLLVAYYIYTLSASYEKILPEDQYNSFNNEIKNNEKGNAKELSLLFLDNYAKNIEKQAVLFKKLSFFLIAAAFLALCALLSLKKAYRELVSNKSLNLTGAKDAPPS